MSGSTNPRALGLTSSSPCPLTLRAKEPRAPAHHRHRRFLTATRRANRCLLPPWPDPVLRGLRSPPPPARDDFANLSNQLYRPRADQDRAIVLPCCASIPLPRGPAP